MSERRRLFFALWPPRHVAAALDDREELARQHCDGRFVPASNRHVTLAFLGSVGASELPGIARAAETVCASPFTLPVTGLQLWRRARILSLVPDPVPAALIELHAALWSALAPLGLRAERRTFRPHITLARNASCRGGLPQPTAFDWPVDAFALTESVPGRRAPEYVQLARYVLEPD